MGHRPSHGQMVWWRFRNQPGQWSFGYCTYMAGSYELVRMGNWAGQTNGGQVVSVSEIEWKPYR